MPSNPLRILIVGGVAGGASAATRARRMNEHARIILFEKDEHISFANCGLPYYLGGEIAQRDKLLVAKPELFRNRFRIDVRTRQEVTAIDRPRKSIRVLNHATGEQYDEPYDKLILAPGASPIVPPLDGRDAPNVFTLRNLADTDAIHTFLQNEKPKHITMVGAGFIGLEMVEQLRGLGIAVALVELQDHVLPLLDFEMAQPIADELIAKGVDLRLGSGIAAPGSFKLRDGWVNLVTLDNGDAIETDGVILGIGVRPNTKLAEQSGLELGPTRGIATNPFMQTSDPDIYAVGDAAEYTYGPTAAPMRVPLAGPANRAGRIAGQHAATGSADAMAPVFGTAIVRVFGVSAGMTGLTMQAAKRLGIDARSVTVVANHHAGYFPGAKPITLKLVYANDGKVLGAQAIGGEGVDKRLDVIATVMALGGTVRQLTGLDLAYAPPFGSAKDPVHMAGFAACNDLDGVSPVLQPDADLTGYQVVDVRNTPEVAKAPLPDVQTIHIPLDELRDRLDELDRDKPTVCSCATGLRSHVACRILKQHGFKEVYNLTGAATQRRRSIRPQVKEAVP